MITVTIVGSGGATPYQARTTAMLVVDAAGARALIDCGSGASHRIAEAGIAASSIDALFFTHFHADHCIDFPVFVMTSYLAGRRAPLRIYGPSGVGRFVDLMLKELFPYISKLVSALTEVPFEVIVEELAPEAEVVLEGLHVKAGAAKHSVPSLCYRFDTATESVAVSGDTEATSTVVALAKDCRLLIHECPFPVHMGRIPDHTQASEVGVIANEACAGAVLLTHLFEEVVGHEQEMIEAVRAAFAGQIVIAEDLMTLTVDGPNIVVGGVGEPTR